MGSLETGMEQLELGGRVQNALPDSLPRCGLRRRDVRLGAGPRGCWLVIETLILAGNLGSHMEAEPCGVLQAGTGMGSAHGTG